MDLSIIFSAASLILCVFFFVYFRAYLRRRTGSERILAEFREEVYKLIAEIDAATDKDAILVEERIKTLRSILEDVDKRIGVHIREMDKRRFQEETYAELGKKRSIIGAYPSANKEFSKAYDLFANNARKITDFNSFSEKVRSDQTDELTHTTEEPQEAERTVPHIVHRELPPKPLPLTQQVAELSKAGLSPNLIALRLGVSISEVELAIAISEGS
jgi:hypothetical protein